MTRVERLVIVSTSIGWLALASASAAADAEIPYLMGDALRTTFAGSTLIGRDWAEYYSPDGLIVGKVRYLGMVRDFNGRWSVRHDRVCFAYEWPQYDTCSKFRLAGERMRHFGADGKPKADGESQRFAGNRLDEFR